VWLASLLNCPILNKLKNLVVNLNDHFGKYQSPEGCLGEVNSGYWYDLAYKILVKNPEEDFCAPLYLPWTRL
jgi:hypothetical protein